MLHAVLEVIDYLLEHFSLRRTRDLQVGKCLRLREDQRHVTEPSDEVEVEEGSYPSGLCEVSFPVGNIVFPGLDAFDGELQSLMTA